MELLIQRNLNSQLLLQGAYALSQIVLFLSVFLISQHLTVFKLKKGMQQWIVHNTNCLPYPMLDRTWCRGHIFRSERSRKQSEKAPRGNGNSGDGVGLMRFSKSYASRTWVLPVFLYSKRCWYGASQYTNAIMSTKAADSKAVLSLGRQVRDK